MTLRGTQPMRARPRLFHFPTVPIADDLFQKLNVIELKHQLIEERITYKH